jgi:benzoyl-CoA reductase/2-hydroxyglutaryl-CoA dehydratase subunit BcrC/BadD/HgdB
MMKQYFDEVSAGIEAKLRAGPNGDTARKKLTLEIARLGARLFSSESRVAWCGVLVPFDLLHAMGVTSCFVEFVGAVLASTNAAGPMLEAAEQAGYGTDGCGYHRAVTGATLQGLMPDPDFLVASSAPCSGGLAVLENLARHFKKDLFVVHIPQGAGGDGVAYLADQFRAVVSFVEAHTGRLLDPARLRTVMERTNRTRAILLDLYEIARSVPSPARPRDMVNFGILMPLLLGTEAGVRVAEAYRDEFSRKARVQESAGAATGGRVPGGGGHRRTKRHNLGSH